MVQGGLFGNARSKCWKNNPCWTRCMTIVRSSAHWIAWFSHLYLAYFQEQINTKAIDKLIQKLTDNDEDVRAEAVRACTVLGEHRLLIRFTDILLLIFLFSCFSGKIQNSEAHARIRTADQRQWWGCTRWGSAGSFEIQRPWLAN